MVSYKDLYGWTMDEIVAQIGTKNNCTFCGVFRRQALDRGAVLCRANKVGQQPWHPVPTPPLDDHPPGSLYFVKM